MSTVKELLHKIANPALTHNERARLRCQIAKRMEEMGNYEVAREAMGGLWLGVGERPILEGLDSTTSAEVLLRVGVLTGWIGSIKQIENSQELAKNLISESITRFEELRDERKVAEAQMELGPCYWREGALSEARIVLQEAMGRIDEEDGDLKANTLLRLATIEEVTLRLSDALRLLTEAAPLFEASSNHAIRGRFHNEYGTVLKNLGAVEQRSDYIDRALIEYAAASYHFEQAGHRRYQACVENNLAMLFCTAGRYAEAHEHLDRAQALFTSLKDSVHLAQVDETRARVFLAEGLVADAEKLVRSAVQVLERGGEQSLLAEALRTHGTALARMGQHGVARLVLERAVEVAESAGDVEGAGQAALTIIEELGRQLAPHDLSETYERASELLAGSRHPGNKDRLLACVRHVLYAVGAVQVPVEWEGFSFMEAVRRYEARLIGAALTDADGVVTRAAQLLGLSRQSLDSMLRRRHRSLVSLRTPTAPRRSSLMFRENDCPETRPVTILHVEDDEAVADAVRETLEGEGWQVEVCGDGLAALERLGGGEQYDLLIFDNQLPGLSGLELTRRVRAMPHRQQTPIIMLTSSHEVEADARRAGANAFLRKPDDATLIAETVARLLARKIKQY